MSNRPNTNPKGIHYISSHAVEYRFHLSQPPVLIDSSESAISQTQRERINCMYRQAKKFLRKSIILSVVSDKLTKIVGAEIRHYKRLRFSANGTLNS